MFKCKLPKLYEMLNAVPKEDQPEDMQKFWWSVATELKELIEHAAEAKEPEICMTSVQHIGSQYLWEFWVNDLSKEKGTSMNFHGQNTSQWLYAGAICLQNGRVSLHH